MTYPKSVHNFPLRVVNAQNKIHCTRSESVLFYDKWLDIKIIISFESKVRIFFLSLYISGSFDTCTGLKNLFPAYLQFHAIFHRLSSLILSTRPFHFDYIIDIQFIALFYHLYREYYLKDLIYVVLILAFLLSNVHISLPYFTTGSNFKYVLLNIILTQCCTFINSIYVFVFILDRIIRETFQYPNHRAESFYFVFLHRNASSFVSKANDFGYSEVTTRILRTALCYEAHKENKGLHPSLSFLQVISM